jgi:Xaa-Pro aminopeptidase
LLSNCFCVFLIGFYNPIGGLFMDVQSISRRLAAITEAMKAGGVSCLIVTKPANVTYSTGFLGDDSLAVIAKGRSYLLTDSRYTEQAHKECPACRIIQRNSSMPQAVAGLVNKLKNIQDVTIENSISMELFDRLKKAVDTKIKRSENIIENIRSVKDDSEIEAIKAAADIAAKALEQTLNYIKVGMTESELAGLLELEIRRLGAKTSFETIVAFGPNASRAHHQPGSRKLKKNDTVLIDFGAKYNGYCSDITRCFVVGRGDRFFNSVFDAVEQAQLAAIQMVKAGAEIACVDAAARKTLAKSGLPVYGHGTGHGLGIEIHESPFIKPENGGVLKEGQVITIEPGVYVPGKIGIRIEDDVLVTKSGCKILTSSCPYKFSL